MQAGTRRPRIGMNAMLYSSVLSYRSAGVSHYIAGLLGSLPQVDPGSDYVAFTSEPANTFAGWRMLAQPSVGANPLRRILWEQVQQPGLLRQEGVDLIHAPVYVGPWCSPCPVVVTIHDLSHFLFPQLFKPAKRAYLQFMTRYTARRAAAVICDSQSTRRDVLDLLHIEENRVYSVLIGVDNTMRPLEPEAIARFKHERHLPEKYLLSVSTLEPRKNIRALIEAYALLCEQIVEPPQLVIGGGKGWYFEDIERQVQRLGLAGRVTFPGYIPQQELPLWYNGAELFIYPSLYEGFGMPPLEAMACGIPVITSDRSSLPEVVGEAGIMLDTSQPALLAQEILGLLRNEPRRLELAEAGIKRASMFSWRKTAEQTAAIYHSVLKNRQTNDSSA
jgi:glycosyltransferase involved in cell wall biosynthesis